MEADRTIHISYLPFSPHTHIMGKMCRDYNDFIFDQIFIKLADKEDKQKILIESSSDLLVMNHKILDEFDFRTDQTIHMKVTFPLVSHGHIMGKMLC